MSEKFIEGLKKRGFEYSDVRKWHYCGDDKDGGGLNYFRISCPNIDFPDKVDQCVCGHKIHHNFYITGIKKDILVLGSTCIKNFIDYSGKTCQDCGLPHKNRKDNFCNECREYNRVYYICHTSRQMIQDILGIDTNCVYMDSKKVQLLRNIIIENDMTLLISKTTIEIPQLERTNLLVKCIKCGSTFHNYGKWCRWCVECFENTMNNSFI
jgi:hypothetical protein